MGMPVFSKEVDIMEANGTLIWYYNICKREVWLMARGIVPDQQNENVDLGRFIHEQSYTRKDKEISFGNVRFDVLLQSKDKLIIGETKKSSKFKEASKWQLMFYLKVLRDAGITAEGRLLYPEERKRMNVELTEENEAELDKMIKCIEDICMQQKPDEVKKNPYCRSCAYKEYCYA